MVSYSLGAQEDSHCGGYEVVSCVALVCISQIANDTERNHSDIRPSSFLISLFKSCTKCRIGWHIFLLMHRKSSFYILDTRTLPYLWFANIFTSLWLIFIYLMVSFEMQKLLNFYEAKFIIFSLTDCVLILYLQMLCLTLVMKISF